MVTTNNSVSGRKRKQRTSPENKRRQKSKYNKENKGKWKEFQNDNTQRRSTRLKYRKMAEDTQQNRAKLLDIGSSTNHFKQTLIEQQQIHKEVRHPNEACMDIEQVNTMSHILVEQANTVKNEDIPFENDEYIASLQRLFSVNDEESDDDDDEKELILIDWAAIGCKMAPYFLTVPTIQFMNGPLQQCEHILPEVKKSKSRRVRKKQTFQTDAPIIEPSKIIKQNKSDKTETKSRVAHLKKTLRKKCEKERVGVNPLEFLVNPDSFSQTVENFFDMSFIMKEGFAQMDMDNDTQQPVLSYISSAERTRRHIQQNSSKKSNGQCIIKFNPRMFAQCIQTYGISESQIERADINDSDEEQNENESNSEVKRGRKGRGRNQRENDSNDKEEAD